MLVQKGEYIVKPCEDGETGVVYEVIMADDEFFCVGEVTYNPDEDKFSTSFEGVEIYSNLEEINTLEELGFIN